MVICYVVADGLTEYNSSNFRVSVIADALRRAGHEVHILNVREWVGQSTYAKQILDKADIIHLQRVLLRDTHNIIKYWRARGKAVVADWDDSYDRILESNAASKFWLHGKVDVQVSRFVKYEADLPEHPIEQFRAGLQVCTAGITPSRVLSKDWETCAPVFKVPNFLDSKAYHGARKHDNGDIIVLGWGGSLSHTQSFADSGIQEALKRILQERDNVRLLIMGDDRVVKQLPVRKDRVWFSPYVSWAAWQRSLMRYDIGLAPLAGPYDDRRSSLKVAEYTMAGIPFVATKSPVYEPFFECDSGRFVKHGHEEETYDERVKDWYHSTIDIIDNIGYYTDLAIGNIGDVGMKFDADANVPNVISVYERIIDLEA
jgi:glycosyltransferase involved in cell wall biosynthesis